MQVRLTKTLTFTLALCGVYEEELSLISDYRLVAVKKQNTGILFSIETFELL